MKLQNVCTYVKSLWIWKNVHTQNTLHISIKFMDFKKRLVYLKECSWIWKTWLQIYKKFMNLKIIEKLKRSRIFTMFVILRKKSLVWIQFRKFIFFSLIWESLRIWKYVRSCKKRKFIWKKETMKRRKGKNKQKLKNGWKLLEAFENWMEASRSLQNRLATFQKTKHAPALSRPCT